MSTCYKINPPIPVGDFKHPVDEKGVVEIDNNFIHLDIFNGKITGFTRYGANNPDNLIQELQAIGSKSISEHEEEFYDEN